MKTNRDIEIAFVRAHARINEKLENAQIRFMLPDLEDIAGALLKELKDERKKSKEIPVNENNPIANEEIL